MGYQEIRKAAEDLKADREAAKASAIADHEADLRRRDAELEALEVCITDAARLEKDFGGGSSQPDPGGGSAGPRRKQPPARDPLAPGGGRPASDGTKTTQRKAVERARVLEVLTDQIADDGWLSPKVCRARSGLSEWKHRLVLNALLADGEVEEKGNRQQRLIRVRNAARRLEAEGDAGEQSDPPAAAPPPSQPEPEPEPDQLTPLERKVLESVERHPNETVTEVARRIGRGSPAGIQEVQAAMIELTRDGKVDQAPNRGHAKTGGVVWRIPGTPGPPAPAAAVQTSPGGATGETSPKTEAERKVVHAVATGTKSVEELAEATGIPETTISEIVGPLCTRKVLQRAQRGQTPVYGKPLKR